MKRAVYYGFRNYLNFKGEATRPEFWWFFLFFHVAYILGVVLEIALGLNGFIGFVSVVVWLPLLSVSVRRMHDAGKSGWFLLVPIFNLYLLVQPSHLEKSATPEY